MGASLTRLALPYDGSLEVADGDVQMLLTLSKLRKLDLRSSRHKPAPWSLSSLQNMLTLPAAFLTRRGHALAVDVEGDDKQDENYYSDEDL